MTNDRRRLGGPSRRGVLAGAAGAGLLASGVARAATAGTVADTTAGKIRGGRQGGPLVFRSVPYGASTSGANRFMPPQPPKPWAGVREATAFGDVSPQPHSPILTEVAGSLQQDPQGEDCLALHVWTPALDHGKRPVMVWFHGGGYAVGSGSAPWYHGHRLATRHDVVVVTVNHRLNAFGFLYLAEALGPRFADSGNVGMLDCVAALGWVRDNIAGFGGDPGNVTIFGESGGAGKVSTLLGMPPAAGLFHRAIAESGAALRAISADEAARATKSLLDKVGVGPNDVEKLQALPPEAILGQIGPGFAFGPTVDGRSLPRSPFGPDAPEVSADVPLMMGSNLTESTFLPDTPLDPMGETELHAKLKGYLKADDAAVAKVVGAYRAENPGRDPVFLFQLISSDVWMRSQVLTQADRKAAQKRGPMFLYQFNRLSPARGGKLHCPHGSEIPYAFDNIGSAPELTGNDAAAQRLADRMSAAWVAFARTGRPGAGWPAYTLEDRQVMVFDDASRVERDPGARQRAALAEATPKTA